MNIDITSINQHLSALPSTNSLDKALPSVDITDNSTTERFKNRTVESSNNKTSENEALSKEKLEVLAEELHEFFGELNKGLEFSVHEDSGRDVIKVIDRDTKEVVRQYPSEEVLELVAKLSDAAGNFINSQA